MAVDATTNPLIFATVGDVYADVVYVTSIVLVTTTNAGEFEFLDEAGGRVVARGMVDATSDMDVIPVDGRLKSLYLGTIPTGGAAYVYIR